MTTESDRELAERILKMLNTKSVVNTFVNVDTIKDLCGRLLKADEKIKDLEDQLNEWRIVK